jgi:hypothetical protein
MIPDPDQQRALRVLRYWFGEVEVLAVEGVPGDTSPGLASQQLALPIPDGERSTDRGSRWSALRTNDLDALPGSTTAPVRGPGPQGGST